MSEISVPISPPVMTIKQELDERPDHRETEFIQQQFIPIPSEEGHHNLDAGDLLSEIKIEPTKLQFEADQCALLGRINETIESPNKIDFSTADSRPKTKKTLEKPYSCANCGKSYAKLAFLRKHNQKCTGCTNPNDEALKRCPQCPAVFRILKQLRYHLNMHKGERSYECRVEGCSKAFFSPQKRYVHMKSCGKTERFDCTICGASLKSPNSLSNHMVMHREPKHECIICSKKMFIREDLKRHWKKHFADRNVLKDLALGESTTLKIKEELDNDEPQSLETIQNSASECPEDADWDKMSSLPGSYDCNLCAGGFPTETILNIHKIYCNNPSPPQDVRKNCTQCPFCPKIFQSKTNLQHHINRHNGQKSMPCRKEGCTKLFAEKTARWKHEVYCGKDVSLVCTICEATLKSPYSLRTHMRIHEGAPRVACEVCGKSFSARSSLIRHREVHSNQYFECQVCGKLFKNLLKKEQHLRKHETCSTCGAMFVTKYLLAAHLQTHCSASLPIHGKEA